MWKFKGKHGGHVTRAILCGNVKKNGRGHLRGQRFVRAGAVETHMDMSQEPFCVEM